MTDESLNRKQALQSHFRVFLDYDWTLFDTGQFGADLLDDMALRVGLPFEQVKADAARFEADPILGGYDFEAHHALYGLDSRVMWARLDELVRGHDYLYSDSAVLVQELFAAGFDPTILSFGETRFQRAKILPYLERLAGSTQAAARINVEVVMRRKGEHLAETYPDWRGVLVDDVPHQNLPEGFLEIHLDRGRDLTVPLEKPGGFVIANLRQAVDIIKTF